MGNRSIGKGAGGKGGKRKENVRGEKSLSRNCHGGKKGKNGPTLRGKIEKEGTEVVIWLRGKS